MLPAHPLQILNANLEEFELLVVALPLLKESLKGDHHNAYIKLILNQSTHDLLLIRQKPIENIVNGFFILLSSLFNLRLPMYNVDQSTNLNQQR